MELENKVAIGAAIAALAAHEGANVIVADRSIEDAGRIAAG